MIGAGVGALAYEIMRVFRTDRTFAWSDVLATDVGAVGALIVERWISRAETGADELPQGGSDSIHAAM